MGAADLDDVGEILGLPVQRLVQVLERRDQIAGDFLARGDMHDGREGVVRRLAHVHVIVGMHGLLRAHDAAEQLDRAIADHFVGVHVGLRARAGLPDHEREMIVEFSLDDFVGGLADRLREFRVEQAKFLIGHRSRFFEQSEGAHDRLRHALAADLEVHRRALRLCAPIAVGGHFNGTEGVGFRACFRHWLFSFLGFAISVLHYRSCIAALISRCKQSSQHHSTAMQNQTNCHLRI